MRPEKRPPLEFTSVPHREWVVSPLPRLRLPGFLRRLVGYAEVPEALRSAPASAVPRVDTAAWPEVAARLSELRLRLPPGLHGRSDVPDPAEHPHGSVLSVLSVLVGLWEEGERFLALWLTDRAEYPGGVYDMRQWPRIEERSEGTYQIGEREVHVATSRFTILREGDTYEVAAFWPWQPGSWIQALAHARTRAEQEEFLTALHTLRMPPSSVPPYGRP